MAVPECVWRAGVGCASAEEELASRLATLLQGTSSSMRVGGCAACMAGAFSGLGEQEDYKLNQTMHVLATACCRTPELAAVALNPYAHQALLQACNSCPHCRLLLTMCCVAIAVLLCWRGGAGRAVIFSAPEAWHGLRRQAAADGGAAASSGDDDYGLPAAAPCAAVAARAAAQQLLQLRGGHC